MPQYPTTPHSNLIIKHTLTPEEQAAWASNPNNLSNSPGVGGQYQKYLNSLLGPNGQDLFGGAMSEQQWMQSGGYSNPTTQATNSQPNQIPVGSSPQSLISPSPTPNQSTQSPTSTGFQNPYMSLPSYNTNMYPQAFANSGTQNQLDPSGGTGSYTPQNYNKLPTYGFYQ
jgi:hypothetical protein